MFHMPSHIYNNTGVHVDYILFNNASMLPAKDSEQISTYEFQIVSIPLRAVMPDLLFQEGSDGKIDYAECLEVAKGNLDVLFDAAMKYNSDFGILSFVLNFFVPQQNTVGRLLQRKDLKNKSYFISLLNQHLESLIETRRNAYLIDADGVASTIGKRLVFDEAVWAYNHGSTLSDVEETFDAKRIQIPLKASQIYGTEDVPTTFLSTLWSEIDGAFRTLRGIDAVKMVIFDLDDTLWRGVAAETDDSSGSVTEGWPLGLYDAVKALKSRGIILAIASKNTEENARRAWGQIIGKRLSLDDFAIKKINWTSKDHNIGEIIKEANLLPESVVFVDDNPVERQRVTEAFPTIRAIGASLYEIKRILMWSPETQVAHITDESQRRNEMVAQQVVREAARKTMSREDFIASLKVQTTFEVITDTDHKKFPRAFELINKTNQFNTTAKKWTFEQISEALKEGKVLISVDVTDKYSEYGLVGVAIVDRDHVDQVVLSCRVFGLDVELAIAREIEAHIHLQGHKQVRGTLVATEKNGPCQSFFSDAGFSLTDGVWVKPI
jgi:FkbH-like protein